MKNTAILLGFLLAFGSLSAQNRNLNTKVNTGKSLNKSAKLNPVIKNKGSAKSLQTARFSTNFRIKSLPKLSASQADLSKDARKSMKLTPRKPVHQSYFIDYYGGYNKAYFLICNRPFDKNEVYGKYPARAHFSLVRGKEYRVKIMLNPSYYNGVSKNSLGVYLESGNILVNLGGQEYQVSAHQGTSEFNFVFRAETTAIEIGISPLLMPSNETPLPVPPNLRHLPPPPTLTSGLRSEPLPIKFIQIDEI